MRTRGVLVRDRSADPGCDGCVRITLGTREQTEQGIAALEESLAAIEWTRENRMKKKRTARQSPQNRGNRDSPEA